jgi:hypothetical protein
LNFLRLGNRLVRLVTPRRLRHLRTPGQAM